MQIRTFSRSALRTRIVKPEYNINFSFLLYLKKCTEFGSYSLTLTEDSLVETFPQAELRRLEQAEREVAHRAAETPEPKLGVDVMLNIWHLNGVLRHPNKSQARRLQQTI
ncbi:hypothetical protein TNCV_1012701 [Trichonephila clavipes]|uniref:Uncharacterized protein n=1 Tax=Trichonephila clavipes TaxID=2585209 RepID=A0A8X6VX65_TRICX|nr:hypothetical protein TNCV_1012701 [Trichonephila clavipes]